MGSNIPLFVPILIDGKSYARVAWTGGCRPRPLDTIGAEEHRLVRFFFREQMRDWLDFWHDMPEKDVRRTFWFRARYDAHATRRHVSA